MNITYFAPTEKYQDHSFFNNERRKRTNRHGRKNIFRKNIYVLYFPDATGIFPCFLLISLLASSMLLTRIINIIFKE